MRAVAAAIHRHARDAAGRTCQEVGVGPFALLVHPDPSSGLSHATPIAEVADMAALDAAIATVREAFAARGLPARFELTLLAWPEVAVALARAGLAVIEESPILACTPGSFRPRSIGTHPRLRRGPIGADTTVVRWVREQDDMAFACAVMRQGFEVRGGLGAEEVLALRDALASGVRLALAKEDGAPAGSGCSTPIGETTEISTVSTLPTLRRRGVATKIVSFLVEDHFTASGGKLAWASASASDPTVFALLQQVGFDDAGLRVTFG